MTTVEAATDVVVRDGSTISLRSADERDAPALRQFLESLSAESLYHRFHGWPTLSDRRIRALIAPDGGRATTLVAETAGRIVGFATFYQADGGPASRAEVAFAVADALQGHGIGTRLLERLASRARTDGIDTFDAYVLGDNTSMLQMFHDSGFTAAVSLESGIWHVELSLAMTDWFFEQSAARSQNAAAASMRAFFEPRVVAVIGANRTRGKIGSEILNNLVEAGFTGTIVPVHPDAAEIAGRTAYPRVTDIPGAVDLAIVVVPAAHVLDAVDDCIAKNVRAICVISAGFSECDAEGRAREARLLDKVRRAGVRLIGPNCMGLLNTDPAVRLNATFSPVYPPRGQVAMSTQSGALGLAILDCARRLDIGISSFVSVGNKADVSSNDLIQYWAEDPNTSVILLYLESFGNPKKFAEIARRVGRTKPIVAVKAGRSAAGSRAAASHTGALASNDAVVDALFRQAGVIRTGRLEEMFDVAALLSHQPVPRGSRVAILTNAGGPGILAADACEANGLELPALGETTCAELRSFLPAAASVNNPIDMLASATPEQFGRALAAILRDPAVDSVITIFIPPLVTEPQAVAAAITAAAAGHRDKPVLGVFMRAEGAPAALSPIPSYAFPESAALALARVTAYAKWRAKPVVPAPSLAGIDRDAIRRILDAATTSGAEWLSPEDAQALLTAAGITTPAARAVASAAEAVEAATRIGYPVVLKALGPTLLHKTERKGVALNLRDADAVRAAHADFEQRLGADMTGVLVQRMITAGAEMIVGALQDPLFGPLIACGTGGVMVDVLADTAFRLHPLTASDATDMIDELRGARLLRGYRGSPPADEAALRDVLLRVSAIVGVAPEIRELDLNPVIVLPTGACVADVRVRLGSMAVESRGRRIEY
ncbi:MAG TPA: GNAT family N-acetyltransferase [Vicinamibacterales bacterium]|nr:GNAT family N-acetyltransferase [Vicinamibacterales bacterium]